MFSAAALSLSKALLHQINEDDLHQLFWDHLEKLNGLNMTPMYFYNTRYESEQRTTINDFLDEQKRKLQ